jgi:hypothetical protein
MTGWATSMQSSCALAASLILGIGAAYKLRHFVHFRYDFEGYGLLPQALVSPAALLFVLSELAAALFLPFGATRAAGALLGVSVVVAATAAVVINLLRGRVVACGCGGLSGGQDISVLMVFRNLLLVVVLLAAAGSVPGAAGIEAHYGLTLPTGLILVLGYAWLSQFAANSAQLRTGAV